MYPATKDNNSKTVCLACSVFQMELDYLLKSGALSIPVKYVNSMMHMEPELLNKKLSEEINTIQASNHDVLLLFGECHNHMDEIEKNSAVHRVIGCNCVEIMMGTELFHKLQKDGAFFLIYEWARRWREIFETELGLKGQTAKDFMREMHKYLLYIDTGLHPVPQDMLDEASDYLGLPWRSLKIDTTQLQQNLIDTLKHCGGQHG